MFKVNDNISFGKNGNDVIIEVNERCRCFSITKDEWISVITEMSHKPENAEQHKKAEEFHLGKV